MERRKNPNRKEPVSPSPTKKPYFRPVLAVYGDVRDLTLGATGDIGESGNPTTHRP